MDDTSIISIHYGHNATVALLQDGEVKLCVSEERFNRIKNSTGFPDRALQYVEDKLGRKARYYVFTQRYHWGYLFMKAREFKSVAYTQTYADQKLGVPWRMRISPDWHYKRAMYLTRRSTEQAEGDTRSRQEMEQFFAGRLGVGQDRIIYMDHHLSHALSVNLFQERPGEQILVFTLDAEGDGLCATVNVVQGDRVEVLARTSRAHSLGYLYREVTGYLGMKPDEHEFKVMGLAPYAKPEHVHELLPIFQQLLWLNESDNFESVVPLPAVQHYLRETLAYRRFDNIAGAVQEFTETITVDWVQRWVNRTGIDTIGLAGGVFMNVKMNQRISELPEVGQVTIVPSAGDESTVLGGCYHGYSRLCREQQLKPDLKRLEHLYLGTEYSDAELDCFLQEAGYFNRYEITSPPDMATAVAALLAQNDVVARFDGPMEFGARALGNRSILANPSSYENVRIINEMIKNRDFWMPFAATILAEDAPRYLVNLRGIAAPFMAITFATTAQAHRDLPAALHPYDKTSRPQVLNEAANPRYYRTINHFKQLTGIGGVLNTSFNLHGEPVVEGPADAMHVFNESGLQYLALGPFLIHKTQ